MRSLNEFKASLARSSPWLTAFFLTADEQVVKRLRDKVSVRSYEPLLVEPLLEDISTILDRASAYRREAYDLDILATKAAADYQLFNDLLPIDQLLEINSLQEPRLEEENSGFKQTSEAFTKAGEAERLAPGLSAANLTLAIAAGTSQILASERRTLLRKRWDLLREFQDSYNSRHDAPNNAHNYRERMIRVVTLLADDVDDAYSRCQAVAIGLKQVFRIDHPCPPRDTAVLLDALVTWTREAIRLVEAEAQNESAYDVVIPLAQPWRATDDPLIPKRDLINIIEQESALKDIRFSLDRVFNNQRNLRLRAVGLSFGADPETTGGNNTNYNVLDRYAYWRLRATIHTPRQLCTSNRELSYFRPPIVLGDVSVFGRSIPVAWQGGLSCFNVNPSGEWRIVLHRNSVWATAEETDIEGGFARHIVRDLKLHLRVISKPAQGEASVFWSKP